MITTPSFQIDVQTESDALWSYSLPATGAAWAFAPPVFEVDGLTVSGALADVTADAPASITPRVTEHRYRGRLQADPGLSLELCFRVAEDSPVARVRYRLGSDRPRRLTKAGGGDALTYMALSLAGMPDVKEVRFSEFNEMVHSYCLAERGLEERQFANSLRVMGPLLAASGPRESFLLAYEHGSQAPDAFLQFHLAPDRTIALRAVKGNYYDGQGIDAEHPYETLWLQAAAVANNEESLARAYREFVLRDLSAHDASRQPYLFYNSWALQERGMWWRGESCLDSLTDERMLVEIDAAHAMGIEVFVLDTGWYESTGDWQVSPTRFPQGLGAVKARLDGYGMKLGLWFNPAEASLTSRMHRDHADCLLTIDGTPRKPNRVWDTPESQALCLVSRYCEAFADKLIALNRELGVTYFKWDAVGQYGCDDPHHFHGTTANTREERADSCAFQQVAYMARIVDKLCTACPDAIVDFDVTEGGRSVGLAFLTAGKYFLINNGPYEVSYDMLPQSDGSNLFVRPGPARARICRTPLPLDKWIPSVLFLTHYLPDDPESSQWINIASLVLGQNGIWGDLAGVSAEGAGRIGETLRRYKQVRDDITRAPLTLSGVPGGSPEVYEKINPETGRGVVSLFAGAEGRYSYVTHLPVSAALWHSPGVTVTRDESGRAILEAEFNSSGARIVFFGADA